MLCLPPLEQPLWRVQMWWHLLAVAKVSLSYGDGQAQGSPASLRRSWWAKSRFKGLQEFQELLFVGKGQAGLCFLAKVA